MRFPTAFELEQESAAYEAEMALRWTNPLPPEPRDQDLGPRAKQTDYCRTCGKLFDHYATQGMRTMQLRRHMTRAHADVVEAY